MKDKHFTSRMLTVAGTLMGISGILTAVCAKLACGGVVFAAAACMLFSSAACMFFAARSFRIAEDKNNTGKQ